METFYRTVADQDITMDDLLQSFHGCALGHMVQFAIIRQDERRIPSTLAFLSSSLALCLNKDFGDRSDFLFFSSLFYGQCLIETARDKWMGNPLSDNLLRAQRHYLQVRGSPNLNNVLRERLELRNMSDPWWHFWDIPD